jgi:iron complex outermembrane receptor protein
MIVLGLIPLLLAAPVDSAGVPGDTVIVLPGVQVERARVAGETRRRMPTASVTELEAGASGRALETLAELLGGAAGVHVRQYGGLGAFSTVSLRGAPPGQVTVFLDGSPLTAASHSVVSLGDLPATAVERIEIYRGSSPLELGPGAPGGAINLVTVSSPELRALRVARGSFGTWEARGSAGARHGDFSGLLHAGYQASRGDFDYPDDNGTPFNPADDSLSTRANNRFSAGTLLARMSWRPDGRWRLGLRADLFDKAQGVPGLGAVPALDTHLELSRLLTRADAERTGEGVVPDVRLTAGLSRERTRFRDPGAELGLGRHDTDDRTGGASANLEVGWREMTRGLALVLSGSLRREWARMSDVADGYPDPPESRRLTGGGSARIEWRPAGERVVVHAAGRLDRIEDRIHWVEAGGVARSRETARTLATPQVGVRIAGPASLELRANLAAASRAPDFLELFGNQGSVLGNSALRPEHTEGGDVGLAWRHRFSHDVALSLDAAYFESRAEDLVVYVRHSQSSVRAENIGRARIRGQELALRLDAPAGIGLAGGLTHLDARDEGPVPYWNGRRLPLRPELQAFARVDWRRGAVRLAGDLQAIGEDYLDRANLQPVPERLLIGALVSYEPGVAGLRLTLEGKNLGNDRVADVGGFPLPGRAVFAACELRLGPSSHSSIP